MTSEDFRVKMTWSKTSYTLEEVIIVHSERYGKDVIAFPGDSFDGATSAVDVCPMAWIPHDVLCRDGRFADGTKCTNLQASFVAYDQLIKYGRWFRARTWFLATLAFGGGEARKNGIFKLKED